MNKPTACAGIDLLETHHKHKKDIEPPKYVPGN